MSWLLHKYSGSKWRHTSPERVQIICSLVNAKYSHYFPIIKKMADILRAVNNFNFLQSKGWYGVIFTVNKTQMICSTKHNDTTDVSFLFFKQKKTLWKVSAISKDVLPVWLNTPATSSLIGGRSVPCLVTHWGQAEITTNTPRASLFLFHISFSICMPSGLERFLALNTCGFFFLFFFCLQLSFSPEDKLMLV